MFKRGQKLQSLLTVLITWTVLLAFVFAYEAYFVKGQEGFLRERGFRVLALISNELRAKAYQAQVSAASSVKVIQKEAREKESGPNKDFTEYLKLYLPDVLTRGEIYRFLEKCWVDANEQVPLKTSLEDGGLILRISCYSSEDPNARDNPDLNSVMPIYKLDLSEQVRRAFAPLGSYFDDILVADSTGRVIFQESNTAPRIIDLKAFSPNKNNTSAKQNTATQDSAQTNSNTRDIEDRWIQSLNRTNSFTPVTLADEGYELFSQPGHISTGNYSAVGVAEFDFVVCGLRRASSFGAASHAIPYTVLIWLALLAVALFSLSWPFFKLHYMSNTERFSPRDGWYLIFAIVLASTSTMVMFLNSTYESEAEAIADDNRRQLAGKIKEHVQSELYAAASQLQRLSTNPEFQNLFKDNSHPFIPNYLNGKNFSKTQPDPCYPYFEIAFWADRVGLQRFKLDVHPVTTPVTNVRLNEYFTASMSDLIQMPSLEQGKDGAKRAPPGAQASDCTKSPAPVIGIADHLHLQLQSSPNTGEFYLILASPVPMEETEHPPEQIAVQALATRPLSLVDPLMPPGYSFAVIDQQCDVLFDSDSFRNLRENFCEESKTKDELKPGLFSGVDKTIDISYSGRPGRAFLTSLTLHGLTAGQAFLIVFEDPDLKPTLNLAIILVCSVLMGAWFFVFLALAIAHLALRAPLHLICPPEFIWPSPGNAVSCAQIFIANGLMFLLFWTFYQQLYEGPLLGLTLAVAIFTVLFSLLKLCRKTGMLFRVGRILTMASAAVFIAFVVFLVMALRHHDSPEPLEEWMLLLGLLGVFGQIAVLLSGEPSVLLRLAGRGSKSIGWIEKNAMKRFSVVYALAALSIINAVGLAPCVGFFKYSYDAVSELSLKRDQIVLSEKILERKDRIQKYYETLEAPKFVKARLSSPWDRYDSIFFSTDCEPIVSDPCVQSSGQERAAFSRAGEVLNNRIEKSIALATLVFPSNPMGLEMSRLGMAATTAGEDRPWEHSWDEISPRRFRLHWDDDSRLPKFAVTSVYPRWGGLGPWYYPGMAFLYVVLVLWLTRLTKKIFFTDIVSTPYFAAVDWKNVVDIKKSYLVIGLAKSSKTDKLRAIAGLPTADWHDLRVELNRMKSPYYHKPSCQGNVLILDHFEANLKDRECNMRRLNLLESLLYETEYRLILVSNVDPLYFLTEGDPEMLTDSKDPEEAKRLLDRWARALSKFTKVRVQDDGETELKEQIERSTDENVNSQLVRWIWEECKYTPFLGQIGMEVLDQFGDKKDATEGWLVSTVLDRADSYYRVLWSGLTPSERLVLYQLALDGWVNRKNIAAIQQLERKRIIYRVPMYRIINRSFRKFIRSPEHVDEFAEWEKSGRQSTWQALRLVLIAAALGGAVWLFHSQTALFQTGVGYVAAIATLLTAVTGLIGRSKRTARAESGPTQ